VMVDKESIGQEREEMGGGRKEWIEA